MKCDCGRGKVEIQYSFGFYAGKMCDKCAYERYADHCGIGGKQGRVEDLAEFEVGGYDAIYGEE